MKATILSLIALIISSHTLAQSSNPFPIDYDKQYDGGTEAFMDLVVKNVRYPLEAKENDRQGTVVIGFTLTKNGKRVDPKIKNSVGMGCDEEAMRIFNMMDGKLASVAGEDKYYEFALKMKLDPSKDVKSIIKKAEKLYSKEKYSEALRIFNEVVRQEPYDTDKLLKRAICRIKTGDQPGACADWNRLKELGQNPVETSLQSSCK